LLLTTRRKFKRGPKGGNKQKSEGKKDMSKVKLFSCNKFGHYVGIFLIIKEEADINFNRGG
jgi:hypothetical protein